MSPIVADDLRGTKGGLLCPSAGRGDPGAKGRVNRGTGRGGGIVADLIERSSEGLLGPAAASCGADLAGSVVAMGGETKGGDVLFLPADVVLADEAR